MVRIRAIDRKLLRDLWGMRGQAVAIALPRGLIAPRVRQGRARVRTSFVPTLQAAGTGAFGECRFHLVQYLLERKGDNVCSHHTGIELGDVREGDGAVPVADAGR